ncbi:MAG: RNA-directed DNA polymerase [Lachnospiraceae bacterium]|nr:RNA-directed DNA polymerase [Lachnospiraceae bacterium]
MRRNDIKIITEQGVKQYKYLYQRMLDKSVIEKAYRKLRKGKTKRKEIQDIDRHFDEEVEKMRLMILNTKPVPVDHPELAYKPKRRTPKIITEKGKKRKIYMPEIHEQWLHHIIIIILEPIITATAYRYSCGSFPNRGAHYGKRRIERWIRKGKNIRNFLKIDIRHFYDSIRLSVLMRELAIRIKDDWFLYIIEICLWGFKKGIPLGFYISQWLANYILEPLDRLINKTLGFDIFERYMDDIVIFNDNKKKLREALIKIMKMLGQRFRLKLKRNYQICKFLYIKKNEKPIGRALDYMGFLFYRDKTLMRKSIMITATRLAKRLGKAKKYDRRFYDKHLRAMISYVGWFNCTDTYNCYLEYIKPCVNIGKIKKIISKVDRRKEHEGLEKGTLCSAA